MAYAFHRYTGNGSTAAYPISFSYISRSHVKVYVDGDLKAEGADYEWGNASTIVFNSPPTAGAKILIRRETHAAGRLVDYINGSSTTASVLDRDSQQAFYMGQEAMDIAEEAIVRDEAGNLDAGGLPIKNVGEPTDPSDVATKNYVDTSPNSAASQAVAAANLAVSAKNDAVDAKEDAEAAQLAAEQAQAAAEQAQTDAEAARDDAIGAKEDAEAARDDAGNQAVAAQGFSTAAAEAAQDAAEAKNAAEEAASIAVGASLGYFIGFRNRIINGDMRIDQRNEGSAVTVNSGDLKRSVDRWRGYATAAAGSFTLQRSTDAPPGFSHSLLATVTAEDTSLVTSDIYVPFSQAIEGLMVADLAWGTADAEDIAISFWIKADIAGNYVASLQNNSINRCYVAVFEVEASDTWERKTIIVPGDTEGTWLTTNGVGIILNLCAIGGSGHHAANLEQWDSGLAKSVPGAENWMMNVGNKIRVTGVQLEKGGTAHAFEQRPLPVELMLCKRYFEKSYSLGTAIGSTTTRGAALSYVAGSGVNSNGGLNFRFQVAKRDIPTCRVYSTETGAEGKIRDNVAATDRDATNDGIGHNGFFSYTADGAANSGLNLTAHFTADADI